MNRTLVEKLRQRTAELAVGPSTVRNAGAPGTVRAAREALKKVRLRGFLVRSQRGFRRVLDRETEAVRRRLPRGARHWGVARKVLNIFLRDVVYHRHLCTAHRLEQIEPWLELPLDAQVARGLRAGQPEAGLPGWRTIKGLSPDVSSAYQAAATAISEQFGVFPIHLEYYWWRENG